MIGLQKQSLTAWMKFRQGLSFRVDKRSHSQSKQSSIREPVSMLQKKITHFLDKVQSWKQYQKEITHWLDEIPSEKQFSYCERESITHVLDEIPSGNQFSCCKRKSLTCWMRFNQGISCVAAKNYSQPSEVPSSNQLYGCRNHSQTRRSSVDGLSFGMATDHLRPRSSASRKNFCKRFIPVVSQYPCPGSNR
jgi:hypothetical protein